MSGSSRHSPTVSWWLLHTASVSAAAWQCKLEPVMETGPGTICKQTKTTKRIVHGSQNSDVSNPKQ